MRCQAGVPYLVEADHPAPSIHAANDTIEVLQKVLSRTIPALSSSDGMSAGVSDHIVLSSPFDPLLMHTQIRD